MRVLFISNTFPPAYTGGAEVANYHTCRGLTRQGIDCSVLVVNNRMPWPLNKWYEVDSIPVHLVNFTTFWRHAWGDVLDWRVYRRVRTELRQLKPDLVYISNVSGASLTPYLACRVMGVPVVSVLHDLWLLCPNNMLYRADGSFCDPKQNPDGCRNCFRRYDFWGNVPYRRAIFAKLTSNVKLFISPSQALIDRHVEAGYSPSRFRLIRYGLREHVPEERHHANVRQVVDTAYQYRTVTFAGGGVEIKGSRILLQAIPLLLSKIKQLRIIVAGTGDKEILAEFGQYTPAIQVLGGVPFREMRSLFAASDLTIVPSVWHENSPMVIYENFQVGTPVVGSDFGGIPELINHRKTGYLFPVGDAGALAERVIHHFTRPAHERRHMHQSCIKEARTNLSLENNIEGTLQVYQEALNI